VQWPHGTIACGQQCGTDPGQSSSVVHALSSQVSPHAVVAALQQCSSVAQSSRPSHTASWSPGQTSAAGMHRGSLMLSTQHCWLPSQVAAPHAMSAAAFAQFTKIAGDLAVTLDAIALQPLLLDQPEQPLVVFGPYAQW